MPTVVKRNQTFIHGKLIHREGAQWGALLTASTSPACLCWLLWAPYLVTLSLSGGSCSSAWKPHLRGHPALLQTLPLDLQLFSFQGLPHSVSGVVLGTRFSGVLLPTSLFTCCGLANLWLWFNNKILQPGVMAHAFSSSTWQEEGGGPTWVPGQFRVTQRNHGLIQANEQKTTT